MEEALNELLAEGDPWPFWDDGINVPSAAPSAKAAPPEMPGKSSAVNEVSASTGLGSSGDSHDSAATRTVGGRGAATSKATAGTKRAAPGEGRGGSGGGKKRQYKRVRTEKLVAQNCAAQRRYRQRKKEKEMELEAGVEALQANVEFLQAEREDMMKKLELAEGLLRLRETELDLIKGTGSGGAPSSLLAPIPSADPLMLQEDFLRPLLDQKAEGEVASTSAPMDDLFGPMPLLLPSPVSETPGITDHSTEGIVASARRYPMVGALVQTLGAVQDGVEIADPNLNILWVNARYTEITGYTWDEAVGRTPKELVKSELNSDSVYQSIRSAIESGLQWKGQYYHRRKDGTHFLQESTIFAVRDESDTPVLFVSIRRPVLTTDGKSWPVEQPHQVAEVGAKGGSCTHVGDCSASSCLIACN